MRPRVFIGSSTKGLPVAYAAQSNLAKECEVEVWDQGVFGPSDIIIDRLVEILNRFETAVLIFTPDDESVISGREVLTPRDNVIFELGMFMGRHGRDRAFVITPSGSDKLRILSDLGGLVRGDYDPRARSLEASLAPTCRRILEKIHQKAPRSGVYVGANWNHLGKNWRTYGNEGGYVDFFGDDIALGPGRYRYPGSADHLDAPWHVFAAQIRRDRAEDPVRIYIVTEQRDGTSRKIYLASHHTQIQILPEHPDELRVPLRYHDFDSWSCLMINIEEIQHEMIQDVKRATGLRIAGPLRIRHVFLAESKSDLPVGFQKRAITVL